MMQLLIISSILLWVVVLLNLCLTLALIRRINTPSATLVETLPIGQNAPDFVAETMGKERVTLADYAERSLVIVFISPTCGHCRPLIPQIESLGIKAKQSGVELIFVSDAEIDQTQAYIQELNITLPVLSAPRQSNPFCTDYKMDSVPSYVAVDAQGKIQMSGYPSDPNWTEMIDKWGKEAT